MGERERKRTSPWMNTEWRFKQMVQFLGYFGIDPRVGILQLDVLHEIAMFAEGLLRAKVSVM